MIGTLGTSSARCCNARRWDDAPARSTSGTPSLEDAGITSVLVEKLGQPVRDGDDGAWTVTVAFCEYRRPTRALSTPDGSDTEQLTPTELAILAQQNANQNATRQRDALAAEVLGR